MFLNILGKRAREDEDNILVYNNTTEKKLNSSSVPLPDFNSSIESLEEKDALNSNLAEDVLTTPKKRGLFDLKFSFFQKRRTDLTPPTPRGKKHPNENNSPFKTLADKLKMNQLNFDVYPYGRGTYSNVYTVEHKEQICLDKDNSELVLKAFHGEKTGFSPGKLKFYTSNMMENYNCVKNLDLPIATILNEETVSKDHYILQEKIPNTLDCSNKEQLKQVRKFFSESRLKEVVMDLQPQNFRVKDGKVVLIDFVEEHPRSEYTTENVNIFNRTAVIEWFAAFLKTDKSKEEIIEALVSTTGYSQAEIEEIDQIKILCALDF